MQIYTDSEPFPLIKYYFFQNTVKEEKRHEKSLERILREKLA